MSRMQNLATRHWSLWWSLCIFPKILLQFLQQRPYSQTPPEFSDGKDTRISDTIKNYCRCYQNWFVMALDTSPIAPLPSQETAPSTFLFEKHSGGRRQRAEMSRGALVAVRGLAKTWRSERYDKTNWSVACGFWKTASWMAGFTERCYWTVLNFTEYRVLFQCYWTGCA